MIISGLDHSISNDHFTSELGLELMHLMCSHNVLSSLNVKEILVASEDERIAVDLSTVAAEITDKTLLQKRTDQIMNSRLELSEGQQCVRDFFLCLTSNAENWPDVYNHFAFKTTYSRKCCKCHNQFTSESTQLFLEISVPTDGFDLNSSIEEELNMCSLVALDCNGMCNDTAIAEKATKLTSGKETEFITVLLSRGTETPDGFNLNMNRTKAFKDVWIR